MKRGDIIFVRGNSLISKLINKVDGQYSHVAIALSDDTILEAQRFKETRIVKNYHENYDIYPINLTDKQRENLIEAAFDLIGFKYDYKQIFQILFKSALPNDRSKYICSEIVIDSLFRVGYLSLEDYNNMIDYTPNQLHLFLELKIKLGW